MRTASLVVLALVAYAFFVVATVPARYVAAQLDAKTGSPVRMDDASGTLWHGAAAVDVTSGPAAIHIDHLTWRLLPSRLLSGRVAFALEARAADANASAVVTRDFTQWHLSGSAAGSAAFAANVMPLLSTWRPEGRMTLETSDLAWNGREARGDVVARWSEATLALSDVRPLGTYVAKLHAEGSRATVDVATMDGPLRITGKGTLTLPSQFVFSGEARPQGPNARALDPLLDLLGPRRPDGARSLEWRMR